ncbi:MAG: M24 family metallopeptidase [Desulfatiglandales bacterium]
MKRSVYRKRVEAFREKLRGMSLDTAWIVQPENRQYLSGFRAEDGQINESSGSLLINEEICFLITDSRYTLQAQKEAPDFQVYTLEKGLVEELPKLAGATGAKVLGFEEDYITWGFHRQVARGLRRLAAPVRLTPLKGSVEAMRVIKDPGEVRAIETSAGLMDEILAQIIDGLEPGLTEKEIAWRIEDLARERGADGLAFPSIVASGPHGALPHAVPTERKIRKGEPIVFDVGVRLNGYRSDMTRTVFLGSPGPKFRKIYRTVRKAQLAALETIQPGVKSTLPDSVARDMIKNAGFGEYFGHALGHGVGLATHEQPRLAPRNPVELKVGMVVTVEPGIYIPRKGGVRLEETVVIEKDGPRILTKDGHIYDF